MTKYKQQPAVYYRRVGNFRERKPRENFCGLVGREYSRRKLSWNVKIGRIMGMVCLKFHGENFYRWVKNHEICEVFSFESFPL